MSNVSSTIYIIIIEKKIHSINAFREQMYRTYPFDYILLHFFEFMLAKYIFSNQVIGFVLIRVRFTVPY